MQQQSGVFRHGAQFQLTGTVIDTPGAQYFWKSGFQYNLRSFFLIWGLAFFFPSFLLVFEKESEGCKKTSGTWEMKFLIYYLLVKEIICWGEIEMYTYIFHVVIVSYFAFGLSVLPSFFVSYSADFRQRKARVQVC